MLPYRCLAGAFYANVCLLKRRINLHTLDASDNQRKVSTGNQTNGNIMSTFLT
jgi:hypothetical protein